jgi:hypothetical protein
MFQIKNTRKNPSLIDANKIITGIGVIAILLPAILYLHSLFPSHSCYNQGLLPSISAYYHTSSRDILVGMICALAFCFAAYNGYSKFDMRAAKFAAICALGVAFVPTSVVNGEHICLIPDGTNFREYVHLTFAACLIITMAIFSLFIFTHREEGKKIAPRKQFFYRFYGFTIIGALLIILLYLLILKKMYPETGSWNLIFWMETVCLVSFGCSWLLKSGLFDRKEN